MRIIVVMVALACAVRVAAAQSTQAVEARLREIVAAATRRDYAALLALDKEFPEQIARIHGGNPRYEWAELDKAAKAKRLEDLSPSSANYSGLGEVVMWTAFPHRVVDVQGWPTGSGAESFVTFDYPDPQHAPIYGGQVVRRVVLDIRLDRTLKFDVVGSIPSKFKFFENVAPRITEVVWTYFREFLFKVGFVGGQWPFSATLQCGNMGAVTRRGVGYSEGTSENVPELAFQGVHVNEPSTCSVAIEDAAGRTDAVRFDTPALGDHGDESYRCWPRPEFRDFGMILGALHCIRPIGTLADAKDFGVGGNKSEQRDAAVGRAAEAPSSSAAAMLIGRWTASNGVDRSFGADGTYAETTSGAAISGSWRLEGNHLVLRITLLNGREIPPETSDYEIVGLSRDSFTIISKSGRRFQSVRVP